MPNKRRLYLAVTGTFIVVVLIVLFASWNSGHSVTVTTDTTPLSLQLNDKMYTINSKQQRLRLPSNTYNYRAIATVDGKQFIVVNTLSLRNTKHINLTLDFSVYKDSAIRDTLCQNYSNDCPFATLKLSTTYTENNQWVVASMHDDRLGNVAAVLKIDATSGKWKIAGGPGTDFESGDFPQSVEEALNQYGY